MIRTVQIASGTAFRRAHDVTSATGRTIISKAAERYDTAKRSKHRFVAYVSKKYSQLAAFVQKVHRANNNEVISIQEVAPSSLENFKKSYASIIPKGMSFESDEQSHIGTLKAVRDADDFKQFQRNSDWDMHGEEKGVAKQFIEDINRMHISIDGDHIGYESDSAVEKLQNFVSKNSAEENDEVRSIELLHLSKFLTQYGPSSLSILFRKQLSGENEERITFGFATGRAVDGSSIDKTSFVSVRYVEERKAYQIEFRSLSPVSFLMSENSVEPVELSDFKSSIEMFAAIQVSAETLRSGGCEFDVVKPPKFKMHLHSSSLIS